MKKLIPVILFLSLLFSTLSLAWTADVHLRWEKTGRTLKIFDGEGKPTGQLAWTGSIGQANVDLGNNEYAPYVWDEVNKIIKFANCSIKLAFPNLQFYQKDKLLLTGKFYPEVKKLGVWTRESAVISDLIIEEIETTKTTDYLKISFKLSTQDQENIVNIKVGGNHRAQFSYSIKALKAGEHRLNLECDIEEIGKDIVIKNKLNEEFIVGREFKNFSWKWTKDEIADHIIEDTSEKFNIKLKQGIYEKDEVKVLSPTDWGPNQIAADADDCSERDDGTIALQGTYQHTLYMSGHSSALYRSRYIGWRWDNVTASGTVNNASYLKVYRGHNNEQQGDVQWLLKGVEEADPAIWAAGNKPSDKTLTAANETGIGQADDFTITGADFTGILQELVNTYTYSGSQALAIVMERTAPALDVEKWWGTCWDYSEGNNEYGELKIVYTPPSTVPQLIMMIY